ncbi:hypothetical protein JIG36_03405 [Actinoplanes sp. LDG1-06]|uniref:Integral membrane protein n=1 Tax=Paractinoplanes ovalisporus TaxID=2810368 RepID=A0ABS2A4G7_9ACTN|nr:hypothetical protein [Actinoplanes ovalisporus]MBM2614600.1 hypothetical protein [Actinoplanes ovalisporus]
MTTDSMSAGSDPRRLLSETRALAHRVRLDQRLTWAALLVLGVVALVAIPFDYFGLVERCDGDSCASWRRGSLFYWPPALLIAYGGIAFAYMRAARARGLGARVLPFVITGGVLTLISMVAWLLARAYWWNNPPADPFPAWVMVLDRLIAPAGTIGLALLVLAWLERNVALAAFTGVYLVIVLVPVTFGWEINTSTAASFVPPQVITAVVLLLGAAGFARARRRRP